MKVGLLKVRISVVERLVGGGYGGGGLPGYVPCTQVQ